MKDLYEKLLKSDAYSGLGENYKLSHVFLMLPGGFNPNNDSIYDLEIQFGFYSKKDHKIHTIKCYQEKFELGDVEDPFSKDEIVSIDISKLAIGPNDFFKTMSELIKEKYQGNIPLKTIVLLQDIEGNFVWNLTVLRSDFKTLNIKIDAVSGEVVEDSLKGLIEMDK